MNNFDTAQLPILDRDGKVVSKEKIREIVFYVYEALKEKGYNPIQQITGYIMSEDPTYITAHKNARALMSKIDRFDLLNIIVEDYIKTL